MQVKPRTCTTQHFVLKVLSRLVHGKITPIYFKECHQPCLSLALPDPNKGPGVVSWLPSDGDIATGSTSLNLPLTAVRRRVDQTFSSL